MTTLNFIEDGYSYKGEYVTIATWKSKRVITHSPSAVAAYNLAKAQGIRNPILIYIPDDTESIGCNRVDDFDDSLSLGDIYEIGRKMAQPLKDRSLL